MQSLRTMNYKSMVRTKCALRRERGVWKAWGFVVSQSWEKIPGPAQVRPRFLTVLNVLRCSDMSPPLLVSTSPGLQHPC